MDKFHKRNQVDFLGAKIFGSFLRHDHFSFPFPSLHPTTCSLINAWALHYKLCVSSWDPSRDYLNIIGWKKSNNRMASRPFKAWLIVHYTLNLPELVLASREERKRGNKRGEKLLIFPVQTCLRKRITLPGYLNCSPSLVKTDSTKKKKVNCLL